MKTKNKILLVYILLFLVGYVMIAETPFMLKAIYNDFVPVKSEQELILEFKISDCKTSDSFNKIFFEQISTILIVGDFQYPEIKINFTTLYSQDMVSKLISYRTLRISLTSQTFSANLV